MSKFIVTAVAALSMLFVGLRSLSYRSQTVNGLNLSNDSAEAVAAADAAASGGLGTVSVALPQLLGLGVILLLFAMLALTR